MAAPKCRLCGHNHWNTEPHKFDTNVSDSLAPKSKPTKKANSSVQKQAQTVQESEPVPMLEPETKQPEKPSEAATIREKERERARAWRERNREKVREYKRKYMADYRKGIKRT